MLYRFCLVTLISSFLPLAALAADQGVTGGDPARSIETMCQQLSNYQGDGSADYHAGKDVYGRKVAPADLDSDNQQINIDYPLQIAITFDQAKQFNLLPNTSYTPRMFVGMVEVRKDGSVYFNNKRLSQPQVQFLCDPNVNAVKPLKDTE